MKHYTKYYSASHRVEYVVDSKNIVVDRYFKPLTGLLGYYLLVSGEIAVL